MSDSKWVLDSSTRPPSFLPSGFDTSNYVALSMLSDQWMRYIHKSTGETVNCADFYRQYLAEIAR